MRPREFRGLKDALAIFLELLQDLGSTRTARAAQVFDGRSTSRPLLDFCEEPLRFGSPVDARWHRSFSFRSQWSGSARAMRRNSIQLFVKCYRRIANLWATSFPMGHAIQEMTEMQEDPNPVGKVMTRGQSRDRRRRTWSAYPEHTGSRR